MGDPPKPHGQSDNTKGDNGISSTAESKKNDAEALKDEKAIDKERAFNDLLEKYKKVHAALGPGLAKNFFDAGGAQFLKEEKEEKKKDTGLDTAKKSLESQKLQSDIKRDPNGKLGFPGAPPGYGAQYTEVNWTPGSITKPDNPAELTSEQWSNIISASKMMHGYVIRQDGQLVRARLPAFELKPQAKPEAGDEMHRETPPAATNIEVKTGTGGDKHTIAINLHDGKSEKKDTGPKPDFEVYDDASITIKETMTDTQLSMAENSFTSWGITANIAGGVSRFSAAASASAESETTRNRATTSAEQQKQYVATYNFPRARVFLDENNLKVTKGCAESIKVIKDLSEKLQSKLESSSSDEASVKETIKTGLEAIDHFFSRYGHCFTTVFQLGGQLLATKSASSLGTSDLQQARDALQVAAALSFESNFVSGGASGHGGHDKSTDASKSSLSNSSALAWNARGGNTLLCANPALWANSVAPHMEWRVLEQEGVRLTPELIQQLEGETSMQIVEHFSRFKRQAWRIAPTPGSKFRGKIKLSLVSDHKDRFTRMLDNNFEWCDDYGRKDHVILTVLGASREDKGSSPLVWDLNADTAYFLITEGDFARRSDGGQIPGLWVDDLGVLRSEKIQKSQICRWSLRPKDRDPWQKWRPEARDPLPHGSEVRLYCHSFKVGCFAQESPWFAPFVLTSKERRQFRVPDLGTDVLNRPRYSYTENGPSMAGVDYNKLNCWHEFRGPKPDNIDIKAGESRDLYAAMLAVDKNTATGQQEKQVELYTKLFGADDVDNTDKVLSNVSCTIKGDLIPLSTDKVGNLKDLYRNREELRFKWDTKEIKLRPDGGLYNPRKAVDRKLKEWRGMNPGWDEEAIFRVEYVLE